MWATLMKTKLQKQEISAALFVLPHGEKNVSWSPLDSLTKTIPLKDILKNIARGHHIQWDEAVDPTAYDESLFLK
jgi:hypothetical protein